MRIFREVLTTMHALRVKLDVILTLKLSSSNSNDRQVYVNSTWHKLQS